MMMMIIMMIMMMMDNLKGLCHGFAKISIRRLQSVFIFSILNRPCSFTVNYYLFGVCQS